MYQLNINNNVSNKRKLVLEHQTHFCWRKYFHKKPFTFRIYADFEAEKEIDNSNIDRKTTIFYKENTVNNGYYTPTQLDDVLNTGFYGYSLRYDNVYWFVDEVKNLEKK